MTKTIEVPDIAQWEETDSELAKYTIGKLSRELDVSIKVAKSLAQDLENATNRINKAIEYIKTFIEIDEETGTYSMPYTFDANNLYKILKMLEGEDNE